MTSEPVTSPPCRGAVIPTLPAVFAKHTPQVIQQKFSYSSDTYKVMIIYSLRQVCFSFQRLTLLTINVFQFSTVNTLDDKCVSAFNG
jgi:hypothetical protein